LALAELFAGSKTVDEFGVVKKQLAGSSSIDEADVVYVYTRDVYNVPPLVRWQLACNFPLEYNTATN